MSDPFAHLLTSLKNKDSASASKETTPQSSNSPSITGSAVADVARTDKSPNDSLHSISAPPLIPSPKVDFSAPPLVPTNSTTKSNTANNTPPSALANTDDDFNQLFGMGTVTTTDTIQKPDEDYYGSKEDHLYNGDDALVDEVKDMEIARLMSLGLSIEEATEFYENDVTYERYLEILKSKQKERNDLAIRKKESGIKMEKSGLSNIVGTDSNNLFSMATNFFNKGKKLVDQWTSFPPEANDRLNNYSKTHDKVEDYDLPQVNDSPNRILFEDNEVVENLPPADNPDQDLLTDFETKIDITKRTAPDVSHSSSPTSGILIEESSRRNEPLIEDSLLDFSEENLTNSKSNEDSTLFNENSNTDSTIPISDIELSGYNEFKAKGTSLFKNGDYINSLQEYEKSLNTLPLNHPLRIIALSNIIASQLKIGEYSKSIENSSMALELFPSSKAKWKNKISNSDPERSFNDIWPKIMIRRAESFEHLESFKKALETYQELINKNFFDDKIMQGKRRCQDFINPPPVKKSMPVKKKTTTTSPATKKQNLTASSSNSPISVDSTSEIKKRELENAKLALYDKVFEKISSWKDGKDDDIRHLLANLSSLLTWCNWKDVSMQDLVMPKRVKITYMKAVAKTHPDKIPESLSLENKMIAENIFSTLSIAWDKFKLQNDIN